MSLRRSHSLYAPLIAVLAMALSLATPIGSQAQDTDPDYELDMHLTGEPIAEIADRSVEVTVFNEDQSVEFGSCAFDLVNTPGGCVVDVPSSTTVTALLDESTLPEGVVAVENPLTYTTPAEKTSIGDVVFELAYADDSGAPEPDYDLQLMLSGDPVGEIPDQSVSVTVVNTTTREEYGTCLMDMVSKPGGCRVDVPSDVSVMALLDEATLPEGIVVLENPITYTTPAEKTEVGDIWFELAYGDESPEAPEEPELPESPEAPEEPGDVSELPGTGTSPLTSATSWAATTIAVGLGVVAIIFGAGAILTRFIHTR